MKNFSILTELMLIRTWQFRGLWYLLCRFRYFVYVEEVLRIVGKHFFCDVFPSAVVWSSYPLLVVFDPEVAP